ncbi:MAG: triose-phosphate isomerase [Holosporales bacterium]|jgi:triosephosphate isomerase|nr:triose-phosphate isomerase [Holosporales bacterium]
MSRERKKPHQKIFVANWKMQGCTAFSEAYGAFFHQQRSALPSYAQVVLCPPAPYLSAVRLTAQGAVSLGTQNTATEKQGAFTGEISAAMAADSGALYGLVGHSERRHLYYETDSLVQEKALRLGEVGLTPILCVGETGEQHTAGQTLAILTQQLSILGALPFSWPLIIAYEPVWAIGTGKTPTPEEVDQTHRAIQGILTAQGREPLPLLYGGSVTAANAQSFVELDTVDGVLVGGASLKEEVFLSIIRCLEE